MLLETPADGVEGNKDAGPLQQGRGAGLGQRRLPQPQQVHRAGKTSADEPQSGRSVPNPGRVPSRVWASRPAAEVVMKMETGLLISRLFIICQ